MLGVGMCFVRTENMIQSGYFRETRKIKQCKYFRNTLIVVPSIFHKTVKETN
jgi:hypothetical protein